VAQRVRADPPRDALADALRFKIEWIDRTVSRGRGD